MFHFRFSKVFIFKKKVCIEINLIKLTKNTANNNLFTRFVLRSVASESLPATFPLASTACSYLCGFHWQSRTERTQTSHSQRGSNSAGPYNLPVLSVPSGARPDPADGVRDRRGQPPVKCPPPCFVSTLGNDALLSHVAVRSPRRWPCDRFRKCHPQHCSLLVLVIILLMLSLLQLPQCVLTRLEITPISSSPRMVFRWVRQKWFS